MRTAHAPGGRDDARQERGVFFRKQPSCGSFQELRRYGDGSQRLLEIVARGVRKYF